jgi:hypothetical protein
LKHLEHARMVQENYGNPGKMMKSDKMMKSGKMMKSDKMMKTEKEMKH